MTRDEFIKFAKDFGCSDEEIEDALKEHDEFVKNGLNYSYEKIILVKTN